MLPPEPRVTGKHVKHWRYEMLWSNLRAAPYSDHVICSHYDADNSKQVSYFVSFCMWNIIVMDQKNCKKKSVNLIQFTLWLFWPFCVCNFVHHTLIIYIQTIQMPKCEVYVVIWLLLKFIKNFACIHKFSYEMNPMFMYFFNQQHLIISCF